MPLQHGPNQGPILTQQPMHPPPVDINGPLGPPQSMGSMGPYNVAAATPIAAPGMVPLPIPPLQVPPGFTAGTPEDWRSSTSAQFHAKVIQFWASWPEDSAIPTELRTYLSDCEQSNKEPNWSYLYKRLNEAQAESTQRGGRSSLPNPGIADPSTIVKIEYPYGFGGFPGAVGGQVPITIADPRIHGQPMPHPGVLSLVPAMKPFLGMGGQMGFNDNIYMLQRMAAIPM